MQSAKNICAPLGNSPREMVLSTGRYFATTQILINFYMYWTTCSPILNNLLSPEGLSHA